MRIGIPVAALLCAVSARPGHAQQTSPAAEAVDTAAVVGKYDFSLLPKNGEPITGTLTIAVRGHRFYGVLTSPKLSEPADADVLRVTGHEVFMSALDGAYTFTFDIDGKTISHATFTKTMRGTTEQGDLSIRRRDR